MNAFPATWDTGAIMFVGLLVLLLWRFFFPFAFLTERFQQANYALAPGLCGLPLAPPVSSTSNRAIAIEPGSNKLLEACFGTLDYMTIYYIVSNHIYVLACTAKSKAKSKLHYLCSWISCSGEIIYRQTRMMEHSMSGGRFSPEIGVLRRLKAYLALLKGFEAHIGPKHSNIQSSFLLSYRYKLWRRVPVCLASGALHLQLGDLYLHGDGERGQGGLVEPAELAQTADLERARDLLRDPIGGVKRRDRKRIQVTICIYKYE